MGKSGSGKSTLLKLFMRFWEAGDGSVEISGRDIAGINTVDLREMESFMTQETHLFHDSIRSNLRIVSEMIALYCRRQHGKKNALCPECAALAAYARQRSDKCPFMETKTFCANCKVHCYKNANPEIGIEMREKIRAIMRFSGPRMIFRHPVTAVRHVLEVKIWK